MQLSHTVSNVSVAFDDPNLVACAGLAPVMELARRAGLPDLVASKVKVGVPGGVFPAVKVPALIAGMIAGADSIDDLELLRHGGMDRLLPGYMPPPPTAHSCAVSRSVTSANWTRSRPRFWSI